MTSLTALKLRLFVLAFFLCAGSGLVSCSQNAKPGDVNVEESGPKDRNDHERLEDNPNDHTDVGDKNKDIHGEKDAEND